MSSWPAPSSSAQHMSSASEWHARSTPTAPMTIPATWSRASSPVRCCTTRRRPPRAFRRWCAKGRSSAARVNGSRLGSTRSASTATTRRRWRWPSRSATSSKRRGSRSGQWPRRSAKRIVMEAPQMTETLLPTTVVGSYPQPDWLIDRDKLTTLPPVRVRASELWRVPERWLEGAQDDATVLAIRDMERAGIDIITDGEIRRESYSNRFATALSGIDLDNPATVRGRTSGTVVVPRIVGPIRRLRPVEVRDVEFLRANTDHTIKITLPGPFTMSRQAKNEFYADDADMAMDYAQAVNEEARALKAAGADVIQLDEPWMEERPEAARRYGVAALNRALDGIDGPTVVHCCFGYAFAVQNK